MKQQSYEMLLRTIQVHVAFLSNLFPSLTTVSVKKKMKCKKCKKCNNDENLIGGPGELQKLLSTTFISSKFQKLNGN